MKWWLKTIFIISIALNIGVVAAVAYRAANPPRRMFETPEQKLKKARFYWKKILKLTPEQSKEIEKLWVEQQKISREYTVKLSAQRKKMIELFKNDSVDTDTLKNHFTEINNIRAEMGDRLSQNLLTQRGILTHEQREKFIRIISDHLFPEQDRPGGPFKGGFQKGKQPPKPFENEK